VSKRIKAQMLRSFAIRQKKKFTCYRTSSTARETNVHSPVNMQKSQSSYVTELYR